MIGTDPMRPKGNDRRTPPDRRRAGVIGWPISHSLSPRIHGFWLSRHGLDGSYEILGIEPERFHQVFPTLPAQGFAGVNVTIPFKERVLDYATRVTPAVRETGAANTLVFADDGTIEADNTDVAGFLMNVKSSAPDWSARAGSAVVIGAGGAARAIVWALLGEGAPAVTVVNRTRSRAEDLCRHFGERVRSADWQGLDGALDGTATIVNTTSLGMTGQPPLEVSFTPDRRRALVVDIVYNPLKTAFLEAAESNGNPTVSGLGMLLHQAVPGFSAWFGVRPEVDDGLWEAVVEGLQ